MYHKGKAFDFLREILRELEGDDLLLKSRKAMDYLNHILDGAREVTQLAKDHYIPAFAHNSALDFFSMTQEVLPANLIQAQRDSWRPYLSKSGSGGFIPYQLEIG